MVYPVCANGECKIHVVYNQQKSYCSKSYQKGCRPLADLCIADETFTFDDQDVNSQNRVISSHPTIFKNLVLKEEMTKSSNPSPLRIGKYIFFFIINQKKEAITYLSGIFFVILSFSNIFHFSFFIFPFFFPHPLYY